MNINISSKILVINAIKYHFGIHLYFNTKFLKIICFFFSNSNK